MKNFKSIYKNGENYRFDDAEIQKQKLDQHKRPISIRNIDINKIVVSNTVSFGGKEFNYFICYKDAQKVRPLCMFLLKMTPYRKELDNYLLEK